MAVRIRLTRRGSKRRPFYRVVVVDGRVKRDGGFLEQIGQYNPITTPHEFKVDEEKVFDWLKKGAEMSDGARDLLRKHGTLRKWDAVRRGLPIPPEPEKVIEVKAREEEPVEETKTPEPVETPEETKTPESVETPEETKTPESVETPEQAKTPETSEPAEPPEPVKAEAAEAPEAPETPDTPEPPEAAEKPEDTSTP